MLIAGNPTRLMYSRYLNKLVVGYTKVEFEEIRAGKGKGLTGKKRWMRPSIDFLDLDRPLVKEEPASPRPADISPLRPIGKAGERITCLLEWNPSDGERTYHLIVIGTSWEMKSSSCGRIIFLIVLNSSQQSNRLNTKTQHVSKCDSPVNAIAAYGSSSLACCSGTDVILQKLDSTDKDRDKRFHRWGKFQLKSKAVAVSVVEPFLYVTTAQHSLVVLKVDGENVVEHGYDRISRHALHHLGLQHAALLTLTSNKGGSVVGLSKNRESTANQGLQTLFDARLPLTVTRLRESSSRPTWAWDRPVVFGSTIDGTLYQFAILQENELRLLSFVQTLVMKDEAICPFPPRLRSGKKVEPSWEEPESMHVNGDTLSRVAARGILRFKDMLSKEFEADGHDAETGKARVTQFVELAEAVLGSVEDNAVATMAWMKALLQVVL